MPLDAPSEYGASLGPYRKIPKQDAALSLVQGGLNLVVSTDDLAEGETPDATDVRLDQGGVSSDYALTAFNTPASTNDLNVMGIFPFELDTATKLMIRCRPTRLDRWNGTNWLELTGALTGTSGDRVYTAVSQGRFVIANGVDKLKSWDGNDAHTVADLSADSPIARFITRIGNRLLAANIKVAGVFDQNALAWTTDGNITDWTTANNGAGGTSLLPEGSDKSAGFITGLGTVEGGAVIFRQKGLQIGSLTGIGAAPFRFTTVDFQHGTESPYSICSGGIRSGVYWLGEDYMVYHFDGRSTPTAIGIPIADALRTAVADRRNVLGAVNAKHQELWIGVPTSNDGLIKIAYIFSIREWARTGRLVWWKRSLGAGYRGLGFGYVPTSADPIVDTVSSIVDSVTIRVDDFANTQADERILLGDTVGQVYSLDTSTALTTGIWTSRSIGDGINDITVDLVTLTISATTAGSVEVAGSLDGGTTWSNPKTIVVSGPCKSLAFSDVLDLTGNKMQFRLRILSGFLLISKIAYTYDDRGRTR